MATITKEKTNQGFKEDTREAVLIRMYGKNPAAFTHLVRVTNPRNNHFEWYFMTDMVPNAVGGYLLVNEVKTIWANKQSFKEDK